MSDLLSKLPLEISNQIYEELLTDKVDPIELQSAIRDERPKKTLHTNILRVSKLVYAQASTVLYGKNRFRFEYPKKCVLRGGLNMYSLQTRPRKGAFDRIKHGYTTMSAKMLKKLGVVRYINILRCSLKTLRLAFTLKEAPGPVWDWDWENRRLDDDDSALSAARAIASSAVLIDAVGNLQVENRIEIVINSTNESCLVYFEDFAAQIGSEKQWTTTLQRSEKGTEVDEESAEEEEGSPDCGSEAMDDSTRNY